ncbi:hypothetical protein ON010_g12129 [Phytophthora cinnamomi]|nr:hypothetical protein ON010_g12129 [Phytophthora cinnamomi]
MTSLNPQGWSANTITQKLIEMVDKQLQLLEAMNKREVKVEGIRLSQFYAKMGASVDLYFEQLAQYFEAKNIDWQNDDQSSRILAITTANFKGNAAARSARAFARSTLRSQAKELSQLEESLSRFREAIMQVTDMSELDKITYFIRGLVSPTREEVENRRCTTVSQAMKIALKYDRSHHIRGKNFRPSFVPQDRSRSNGNGNQHHQQPTPACAQENEPEPMEIDSGSTRNNRSSSSSMRCRYCKKTGHVIEQCFKPKNKEKYARQNKQKRHERSVANFNAASTSSHAAATQESTAKSDDEVEVVEVEEISTSTLTPVHRGNELIRKQGTCDGKPVTIMFDSGSTCNVIPPGLVENTKTSGVSQVTRFDGTSTKARSVKKGVATIQFGRYRFKKLKFMEWPLGTAQGVVLGKPWFTKFQPSIDWRSHEILFQRLPEVPPPQVKSVTVDISTVDVKRKVKKHEYQDVFRVKICAVPESTDIPEPIRVFVTVYPDVFPDTLPDGLPPSRRVDFELHTKPDAIPSKCAPFRLSNVEQDALDLFVAEKLKQGWIEVSDSPWVSNIFGIPKKDPAT